MEQARFLVGQFLLAMPGIGDPRFERAVIAVCAHDSNGAVGIGLGAIVEGLGLHALLDQLEIERGEAPDAPIHYGGPVETRRGFVVHSRDWSGQDTLDVAGRWALSSTVDVLRAIAGGAGPREWVVALGYAGWGEGQLDGELARPGWLNVEGSVDLIWATPPSRRWATGLAQAGVDPRLLVSGGGTA
jgi:putative transcriptional regulator